jgi:hypothetical protein
MRLDRIATPQLRGATVHDIRTDDGVPFELLRQGSQEGVTLQGVDRRGVDRRQKQGLSTQRLFGCRFHHLVGELLFVLVTLLQSDLRRPKN